jgi:DegV family protein with EDD domain
MTVAIVTDSSACLDPADAQRERITVVPLKVTIGERTYVEGSAGGLTGELIAESLKAKESVTTSRPTPEDFVDAYERLADEGATEIVSVHMSAKISGTLDSALVAAKRSPVAVTVVDTMQVGLAVGFAAGRAARARDAGGAASSISAAARAAGEAATTLMYVDTLEYLRRGGRVTAIGAVIGSALAVKPLLSMIEGEAKVLEKVRTSGRALSRLEALVLAACHDAENGFDIGVQHLAADENAARVASRLAEALGRESVPVDEISAVLGAHSGPGTISVAVAPR